MSRQQQVETPSGIESRAQLILDVAKAASAHLELADVLESLIRSLKPRIQFQAIGVVVIEGESTGLHSLRVEGIRRNPGEAIESIMARVQSTLRISEEIRVKKRLAESHASEFLTSRRPYVCGDIQAQ